MTRQSRDEGSAIVEFVFVALLVLIPLVYLIVAVASVQRGRLTVTNAARDVGRAISGSQSPGQAAQRAAAALRVSLAGQRLTERDVELRYAAADSGCSGARIEPILRPGAEFAVCVVRNQRLPAVPRVVSGRGVRLVGRYVVHIDDFAIAAP